MAMDLVAKIHHSHKYQVEVPKGSMDQQKMNMEDEKDDGTKVDYVS